MRRIAPALLAAALPLSLAFAPATLDAPTDATGEETTAEEPTTITPDPIEFVFHLHGDEDTPVTDDEVYATSGNQVMDTAPPTGNPQSRQLLNYLGGPNTACSDNALFPTWVGYVGAGEVVSDATLTIDVYGSAGGNVDVRVWTDTGGGCNESNVPPHAVTTAALPVGQGHLVVDLPTTGLDPLYEMKIMIVPSGFPSPAQGRFVYDSPEFDATLTFTCQPDDVETEEEAAGADCLPF